MASLTRPLARAVQTYSTALPAASSAPRNVAVKLITTRALHISPPILRESNEQLKNAPGWKEENATASEADVKADREPLPKNVQELQAESIKNLKQKETLMGKVQDEAAHLQAEAKHVEKSVLKGVKHTASTVKEAVVDSADFVAKAFVGGTDHSRIHQKKEEQKRHH